MLDEIKLYRLMEYWRLQMTTNNTFCKTNSQDLTELWKKGELKDGADLLSLQMFDITPVDDWKESLRKAGER